MARRAPAKTPRNQPRQPRSRATVEVILDATIRVLEREGLDTATTSRIAEVAGVSVGTLYQYFANRDAILDALQDREFERATKMLEAVLANPQGESDETIARAVVSKLLELYRAAPALHRVLVVEGLRITPTERVKAFDLKMVTGIRGFLSLAGARIRRQHLDSAAFVIYHSVRAVMLAYLIESPPGVNDAALVDELTDLILRYLSQTEERPPARLRLRGEISA